MDSNRLCSICSDSSATSFCTCSGLTPLLLCDTHVSEHIFKDRTRIHQLLPITALIARTQSSHYDRLKARQDAVALGREELWDNVRRLDKCLEEFTAKLQEIMNALSEYWNVKNAELQGIREQLVESINESVSEAEATLYEENPQFHYKLSQALREFQRGNRSLRLFEYSIDEKGYSSSLENILAITSSLQTVETSVLPLLSQQSITLYKLEESKLGTELKHPLLAATQDTSLCQVDNSSFLLVKCHYVSLMDVVANKCYMKQSTFRARKAAGALKFGNYVYMFGGTGEKTSEKYDLSRNIWLRLGDMSRPLSNFVPVLYQDTVYLADLGCGEANKSNSCNCVICREENSSLPPAANPFGVPISMKAGLPGAFPQPPKKVALQLEAFTLQSETFRTLDVSFPENITALSTIAFVCDGELVIVSANSVYRWEVNSKATSFIVSVLPQSGPMGPSTVFLSSTIVVARAGKYYWFSWNSNQISTYETSSKSITYRAIA